MKSKYISMKSIVLQYMKYKTLYTITIDELLELLLKIHKALEKQNRLDDYNILYDPQFWDINRMVEYNSDLFDWLDDLRQEIYVTSVAFFIKDNVKEVKLCYVTDLDDNLKVIIRNIAIRKIYSGKVDII